MWETKSFAIVDFMFMFMFLIKNFWEKNISKCYLNTNKDEYLLIEFIIIDMI